MATWGIYMHHNLPCRSYSQNSLKVTENITEFKVLTKLQLKIKVSVKYNDVTESITKFKDVNYCQYH